MLTVPRGPLFCLTSAGSTSLRRCAERSHRPFSWFNMSRNRQASCCFVSELPLWYSFRLVGNLMAADRRESLVDFDVHFVAKGTDRAVGHGDVPSGRMSTAEVVADHAITGRVAGNGSRIQLGIQ